MTIARAPWSEVALGAPAGASAGTSVAERRDANPAAARGCAEGRGALRAGLAGTLGSLARFPLQPLHFPRFRPSWDGANARRRLGGEGPLGCSRAVAGLAMLALALAGCGNWSDEDAQFLSAIPQKEDLTLTPLSSASAQSTALTGRTEQRQDALGEPSTTYDTVSAGVGLVNGLVVGLTVGLDFVRSLEPSVREPGRRVWGPYPDRDHPGFDVQVTMQRETTGYRYELQWRRRGEADFVAVIVGHFYGERARGGAGDLLVDFDKAKAVGTANATELNRTIALSYDLSRQTPNELVATQVSGTSERYQYIVYPDGGGEVIFTTNANFWGPPTSANETLLITSRWRADHAGRASIGLSGGDLAPAQGTYTECWSAARLKIFAWRDFDCGLFQTSCGEGSEEDCVF